MIVCFGDSLTAGYQSPCPANPTGRETPYGLFLQEWLGENVPVSVSGICGELTAEMGARFRSDVLARRPRYVVILGGTNDLGWNGAPEEIMRNLLKMYEAARAEGVVPVPVTVPSIRLDLEGGGGDAKAFLDRHLAGRDRLNALIQRYAEAKSLTCIDLFTATSEPDSRQLAERYSNDGIHLTTMGYRLLASLLFDQVFAAAYPASSGRPA